MKVISKKHLFIILIFFLISILFLLFGVRNFKGAFPEASLDFKYSRKEIQGICDNFLREQGFDLDDSYSKTIIFSQDSTAGVFIDKEFGIEKLEELNRKGFNIWSWRCRRFKPLQKEEFKISFNTEGKLKEFQHIYEEARPGANLEQSEALLIAEVFLKETVGLDFNKLVLKEEKQIRQPNRTDYHFEWEVRGFNLDDAVYRYIIKIQGNEVGSYREYLKVPEKWTRGYRKLRSGNNLYQSISTIFYVLLMVVIIINFIYRFRKKDIKFKLAFRFGILIFILQVLSHLNMYPFYLAEYDVTNSFSAFIIQFSFAGLALGLLQGFLIFLAVASGESIYREYFKKKIQLSVLFSKNGFSLTETLLGSIWGYILAMFHIGFVILFYIKSKDFGVWAPAGTEYTEMVNTVIPWIFPLTIGVMASVSEEFTFRVFAIPFFKKLTKSDFLAVIIPAFLWGFLHSNYPQQPGYIRGIEIGIIGIVAGIIMIRYGILATLIWHYAIDAALVGMFLFGSSNLYFIISGLIVVGIVFIPLVLSLISYFRNKGFSDNPDILNEADQLEVTKTKEVHFNHPGLEYVKMKPSKLLILGVLIVLIFIWLISVRSYSPITLFSKPETTVKEAEARAKKFLERKKVDLTKFDICSGITSAYRQVIIEESVNFLREKIIISEVEKYYEKYLAEPFYYIIRFYKPEDKESYYVIIKFNGEIHHYLHHLSEEAPGANLEREGALILINDELNRLLPYFSEDRFEQLDVKTEQRKNRTDFTFTWKDKAGEIHDAYPKLTVRVQGDEVLVTGLNLKIPENWKDEREKQHGFQTLISILLVFCLGLITALMLLTFFSNLNTVKTPFKKIFQVTIILGLIHFISKLLIIKNDLLYYDTSVELIKYFVILMSSKFMSSVLLGVGFAFLIALFYQVNFKRTSTDFIIPYKKKYHWAYIRDSILKGLFAAIISFALIKFYQIISINLNIPYLPVPIFNPRFLSLHYLTINLVLTGILFLVSGSIFLYILYFIIKNYLNPQIWFAYVIVLSIILTGAISRFHFPAFYYLFWFILMFLTALIGFLILFLKENYFSYLILMYFLFLGYISSILYSAVPQMIFKFILISLILLVLIIIFLVSNLKRVSKEASF